MIKAFTTLLLSLCIFLLGGNTQLLAQVKQQEAFYPSHTSQLAALAQFREVLQDPVYTLSYSLPTFEQAADLIATSETVTELEEDQAGSFKYDKGGSDFLTAILFAGTFAHIFWSIIQRCRFTSQFANFSFHRRYLLFRVLRI
ncbi:hypothetical protein GU926_03290 [Nibribacter ruber]|uniref:Uncharacterized protein n=1 Tax=Nibribacter ruber TaxID=2698458 RepID=A0A6P1NRR7_9BACT|nr:hypothetical protein [Nibribacter ruber]QHL86516.1 hypothetical protein GU926_03290 [Nibribacter ruber]